ncbi:extracellular electron transfer flavoprotein PplA [Lacticaseibacillus parakribbianus]|uniref:extracellular electron transfer flavoprotein PplA n=1 Tax=Lacticaseibacillus parakribbianus TaxID=2970927 RepID=UPI0021CB4970|nr:extracellular electron transfer flavoprotein PplA [Lacticaseibacillus parakribbianus]
MKLAKALTSVSLVAVAALTLAACGNANDSKDSSSSKTSSSKVAKKSSSSEKKEETTEAKQTAGGALKDGTYKLEELAFSHGYKVEMSMTVADGKVSDTSYDYVDKDGKSKQDDKDYESSMKAKSGTGPKEYIPELNDSFKKNGSNVGAIDVVSGATESSQSFKNYAAQLVQAAQAGNTDTIQIHNGDKMKDGTYTLEEKNYSHNYRVVFSITVAGGKITKSAYDNVDKDGKSKTKDAAYEKSMKKVNGVGPAEYTKKLNDELVKAQNPAEVDAVSGATSSSNSFVLYAEQLINAAQAGNTAKIEVDNIVFAE